MLEVGFELTIKLEKTCIISSRQSWIDLVEIYRFLYFILFFKILTIHVLNGQKRKIICRGE